MKNRKSKAVRSSSDFHLLARLFFRAAAVPLTRMFYRDPSDPIYDMTVMGFRMLPICLPFDPSKRELLLEPEDKAHNVGIRLVYKISKKVEYQNLLGCNVLTVTI